MSSSRPRRNSISLIPEKREKSCLEQIEKFNKSQASKVSLVIDDLMNYIPEFTALIINRCFVKIINFLSMGNTPQKILDQIINMIQKMLDTSQGNPMAEPYKTLFSDKEFLTGLFLHTSLDENGKFNRPVISLIYHLLIKGPSYFIEFLQESKESVYALMNALADEDGDDRKASLLFNQLFVCNPKVKQSLIEEVKPLIRRFPPHLVVDLMISSQEIKNTMTVQEFEDWLLERHNFTLSDIYQVFSFYMELWNKESSMTLILRTNPPKRLAFIKWFHEMPPQDFVIPFEMTQEALRQMMTPTCKFEIIDSEMYNSNEYNTKDFYFYSRLYVLTHSDPNQLKEYKNVLKFIYSLLQYKNEYVVAATIQVLLIWALKYQFIPPSSVVYQIAEGIETTRSEPLKCIYQIFLQYMGLFHKVAEMMLRTEESLRFQPDKIDIVQKAPWEFKCFEPYLENIPSYDEFDEKKMLQILDCITEYLGIQEQEECVKE